MSMEFSSLEQFISTSPGRNDIWAAYYQLISSAEAKIFSKFKRMAPSLQYKELASYSSPEGNIAGGFQAFSGPGMDWFSCHWQGDHSCQRLELTLCAWLNQKNRVPHFVVTLGTTPEPYFYLDLMPRCNPVLHPDYIEQYYAPVNEQFLNLLNTPGLKPITAPHPGLRAAASPVAQYVHADPNNDAIDQLIAYSDYNLSHWLHWLDNAAPIPKAERPAQRAYDFILRRLIHDTDAGYAGLKQNLGVELTEQLIAAGVGESQMAQARQSGH
jgi:hypothetical protein